MLPETADAMALDPAPATAQRTRRAAARLQVYCRSSIPAPKKAWTSR
ncbi:MAG: hypothetical protein OXU61_03470 [Gammaproteobacteria bacterium]|nr:hypothetical protein [Gammaproteobacteria bacterium]